MDTLSRKEISIRDHSRNDSVLTDSLDNQVEFWMQQRLAPANGDDGRSKFSKAIDTAVHRLDRHWLRDVVVFVTVSAGEIAAPHWHDMCHYGMVGVRESFTDHPKFADSSRSCSEVASHARRRPWGSRSLGHFFPFLFKHRVSGYRESSVER